MLISFKAVSNERKRHYSRVGKNKVATCQQTYSGNEAGAIDAADQ
jgi:hypothetical protein